MTTEFKNLAWIDIETTGLDLHKDTILELGIVVTTTDLNTVGKKSWPIRPTRNVDYSNMPLKVFQMHTDSGLFKDAFNSPYIQGVVEREAIDFLREHEAVNSPMCGSSIHFDRKFLEEHMSDLEKTFHYRNLDVSTLKNVIGLHFSDKCEPFKPSKKKSHRALDDLQDSIDEYHHYLDFMRYYIGNMDL